MIGMRTMLPIHCKFQAKMEKTIERYWRKWAQVQLSVLLGIYWDRSELVQLCFEWAGWVDGIDQSFLLLSN